MIKFVQCIDRNGETVWLNLSAVKIVRRAQKTEKADIVEDFDGNLYVCSFTNIDGVTYESFRGCVVDPL